MSATSAQTLLVLVDLTSHAATLVDIGGDLAGLLGLDLELLHVLDPRRVGNGTREQELDTRGVPLTVASGQPVAEILRAIAQPDVALALMGSRDHLAGDRVTGHVTAAVLRAAKVPVVVVPPNAIWRRHPDATPSVLVPLDGEMRTTAGVKDTVTALRRAGIAVHAVHILDNDAVPRFWDQPGHAAHSFAAVFADRFLPGHDADMEVRTGNPSALLLEAAAEAAADLIVLCWSPDGDAHQARVVQHTLRHSDLPVMLIASPRSTTGSA